MFTRIEAINFRCLKDVDQVLRPFQVLVGPNATGKTTFLDVISFLGKIVSESLDVAIEERVQNFQDLVWNAELGEIQLAVEARIPEIRKKSSDYSVIRYEISIGPERISQNLFS